MDVQEKGKALERAVSAIERAILKSSPNLSNKNFTVESRKIIVDQGVRHELDLYVEVRVADGYTSTFVFECKNWANPVGKNEVIVFAEKIDVARAQRGFFVATGFTQDARAQAAKDGRMELLEATDLQISDIHEVLGFHILGINIKDTQISFNHSMASEVQPDPVDIATAVALLRGERIKLSAFLKAEIAKVHEARTKRYASNKLPDGVYELDASGGRSFEPGEFVLDGREIDNIAIVLKIDAHIVRPPVVASFQVQGRGRAILLGTAQVPGAQFPGMTIVQRG